MRPETSRDGRLRQHVHAVHVLHQFLLRRQRIPTDRAIFRRDFLGDQPGLRGRFPALAPAHVQQTHEQAVQLGDGDPPIHPVPHHRQAPRHPRLQLAAARLHRRPPHAPGGGPQHELAAHHLRAGGLHRRPLGHRQLGHGDPGLRRQVPRGAEAHTNGNRRRDERHAHAHPDGQDLHALHRGHPVGDVAQGLLADSTARGLHRFGDRRL